MKEIEKLYKKMHHDTPLMTALERYVHSNMTPFDVPGHKRGKGNRYLQQFFGESFSQFDVNSSPDLDQLAHPSGVIQEAQDLLAHAYGADKAFFMVNGTTSAVQTMILSVCRPNEKILIPRNAHKSALNALLLSNAIPVFIDCEFHDEWSIPTTVTFDNVRKAIENNRDAKAIMLINPSYYGFCCDLEEIIQLAKLSGLTIIVDEAHGSHFPFQDTFPKSAISLGADLVAVSLHKTGGSLTQSSALLFNKGNVSVDQVQVFSNMLQTTSASYLLMASLDIARKNLALHGNEIFGKLLPQVRAVKNRINELGSYIAYGKEVEGLYGIKTIDETKIGIYVGNLGLTGFEVYEILRTKYGIQLELGDVTMILALAGMGDTEENFNLLYEALKDIKKRYGQKKTLSPLHYRYVNNKLMMTPREAFYANKESVTWEEAQGRIAAESVMAYPPGIPIVVPGERISLETIEYIHFLIEKKAHLTDCADPTFKTIIVVK